MSFTSCHCSGEIAARAMKGKPGHEVLRAPFDDPAGQLAELIRTAPPRSYGLVIRLSANGTPLYALHSRVDGVNHGIVAAVEMNGAVLAIAKGPGRLLRVPLGTIEEELRA